MKAHAIFGDRIDWDAEARRAALQEKPGASPDEMLKNIAEVLGKRTKGAPKPRIVDCGCNIGRFFPQFHEAGFDYTGVDQSPQALETARVRYDDTGAKFVQAMLWEDWPTGLGEFDAALCNAVLQHNLHVEKSPILKRIAQAVRVGGVFGMQESTVLEETPTQLRHDDWIRMVEGHGFTLLKTWHPNPEYSVNDAYLFRRVAL